VEFEVTGEPYPVAAGVELTAYRIIQEALTNTLKHTDGARAGAGAGAGVAQAGGGFGLAGIAERVASCGGYLAVGPTEPDGFAVTARLPAL
jgi:signal transduction histidine kinase